MTLQCEMILFLVTRCNTNSLLINIMALIYKLHLFTPTNYLQFTGDVDIDGGVVKDCPLKRPSQQLVCHLG